MNKKHLMLLMHMELLALGPLYVVLLPRQLLIGCFILLELEFHKALFKCDLQMDTMNFLMKATQIIGFPHRHHIPKMSYRHSLNTYETLYK
jgi:hypothetical protein